MLSPDVVLQCLPQMPGFLTIHSLDDKILWAARIGYGLDESIIGTSASDLVVPEHRELWHSINNRVKYNREIVDYTVRMLTPEPPGWVSLDGRMGPYLEDGAVKYILVIVADASFKVSKHNPTRFLLSPFQREVVAVLLGSPVPLKGATIAARIGEARNSSTLRTTLAALVSRGILHSNRHGYSVTEDFRPIAVDLLR